MGGIAPTDLKGGGDLNPGACEDILPRRYMTSKDYEHFHAEFNSVEAYERLCRLLNNMQEARSVHD